jgi:hypothetical protein
MRSVRVPARGYAGVSIYGQTLDVQLEQLRGAGCTKIYREKVPGARADRRQDPSNAVPARRRAPLQQR